jgi:hypothetical protein
MRCPLPSRLIVAFATLSLPILATAQSPEPAAPAAAPAAMAAPDATAATERKLSYSNKWRIEVSEGANSDGEIVFHVTPKGGSTQVVTVKIDDGTSENRVARTIEKAFDKQLDKRKYDVETDDGEDVLVKKDLSEPEFALELVSSNVKAVRLNVEKE